MDARIREHAALMVDHSTAVGPGDMVLVRAPPVADEFVVALHEAIGERGGVPVALNADGRAHRAFVTAADEVETPTHHLALAEAADVYLDVSAYANAAETGGITEMDVDWYEAYRPVQLELLSKRWCRTLYPSPGGAQLAGMDAASHEDLVWDAILRDWDAQAAHQARLVQRLSAADEVRVVTDRGTDLTMRLGGNEVRSDHGEKNLPGGEVFTSPLPGSVSGTVAVDFPLHRAGVEVGGIELRFEDGRVASYRADHHEAALADVIETDAGSRRLGELGFGMLDVVDRVTHSIMLDEKFGGTVHLALGRGYRDLVAAGNELNESSVHVDLLVDTRRDGRVEADGEVIMADGTYAFEDGF